MRNKEKPSTSLVRNSQTIKRPLVQSEIPQSTKAPIVAVIGWYDVVLMDGAGVPQRSYRWKGPLSLDEPLKADLPHGGQIVFMPPDMPLPGGIMADEEFKLGPDLNKPMEGWPIPSPFGPKKIDWPSIPEIPPLPEKPSIGLKPNPWNNIPPLTPWPGWPFSPGTGKLDLPKDDDSKNKPSGMAPAPLPPSTGLNPDSLIFPKADGKDTVLPPIPGIEPYDKPLDKAVQEGIKGFLDKLGAKTQEKKGKLDAKDYEEAGKDAGMSAGKEFLKWGWEQLQKSLFGGKLTPSSGWEFFKEYPGTTSAVVTLGLGGYGFYLGHDYKKKGKFKIDLGDIEFEWDDNGKESKWGISFKFKFDF